MFRWIKECFKKHPDDGYTYYDKFGQEYSKDEYFKEKEEFDKLSDHVKYPGFPK